MNHGIAVANALALTAATAWLVYLTMPIMKIVRARNAFLLRRGSVADFEWLPQDVPVGFRLERGKAPAIIEAAVSAAEVGHIAEDWPRARALVGMLTQHARRDGAIQADLATTFRGIVAGTGYCSDYVRVFLAASHSAGLFCRQWAFSFDGFGGHGHTFVEVFDRQRRAWVFVDVHNNVYALMRGANNPASALELRQALLSSPSSVEFCRAAPGRLGFAEPTKLLGYYRRGAQQWYLWWGNDVISREHSGLFGLVGKVSGRMAHRLGTLFGALPPLVVLVTPENEFAVAAMERLRRCLLAGFALWGGLAASLLAQLGWRFLYGTDA